jgi:CRISPR-associated protein Cmr2
MKKKYIFLFTLGPVQSFIAQARKLKDLFTGSYMLSELTKTAIKTAVDEGLIIKFPISNNSTNSIPNRFIATTPESKKETLIDIGEKIELAVHQKLESWAHLIKDGAFENYMEKRIQNKVKLKLDRFPDSFWTQLEQQLDIQWAFYPIEQDYISAYKRIEHLVGAMKNTRIFEQFKHNVNDTWEYGEAGRKCNLSGERNALFFGKDSNPQNLLATDYAVAVDTEEVYLRENEGLSAISFVKRFLPIAKSFESIGEISLMHLTQGDNELVKGALKEYKKAFFTNRIIQDVLAKCEQRSINYDGQTFKEGFDEQFLYEENLIKDNFPCGFQLNEIRDRYKNLKSVLNKQKIKLSKYYAALTFDGDEMGKWLSGAKLEGVPNVDFEQFHYDISKRLGDFAKAAEQILSEPKGATVYAGGDDFLGLVNLHYLFEVVRDLRIAFEEMVNAPLKQKYKYETDFTFSAGVAIAHYKTPLSIVLETAKRMMEDVAKEERDRNAFGIAVMKRSGETERIAYNWGTIDVDKNTVSNWDAIETVVEQLLENTESKKSNFSNTFIQNLNRLYGEILALDETVDESEDNPLFNNMFQTDLARLINRSCQVKQKENKSEAIQKLCNALSLLSNEDVRHSYSNFLETLYVCQFLTRQL